VGVAVVDGQGGFRNGDGQSSLGLGTGSSILTELFMQSPGHIAGAWAISRYQPNGVDAGVSNDTAASPVQRAAQHDVAMLALTTDIRHRLAWIAANPGNFTLI
jgi:hypothetical protein